MNENRKIDLNLNTANLRKAAFAIGFGLTVGKFAGECVSAVWGGVIVGVKELISKDASETKKD